MVKRRMLQVKLFQWLFSRLFIVATDGQFGAYDVPGLGKLVYCGLQGWMAPLRRIMQYNDLGHPLCAHLREGTWALDYISNRLLK